MRIFVSVLVLIFCFKSWVIADDVSEFEIEGVSIGDSLLDYFSKEKVDKKGQALYPNKEMLAGTFKDSSFKIYEDIQFHWLANDKDYIIQSISANISFPNNISKCLEKRKKINKDISRLFTNPRKRIGVKELYSM